jgi:hypothetical protein
MSSQGAKPRGDLSPAVVILREPFRGMVTEESQWWEGKMRFPRGVYPELR